MVLDEVGDRQGGGGGEPQHADGDVRAVGQREQVLDLVGHHLVVAGGP
ncbi:hypothetical protein ACIRQY_34085 [Streptomyces sp. NPDC101490]